jgi:hypothetical protein
MVSQVAQEQTLVAATDITIPAVSFEPVLINIPLDQYNHRSNIEIRSIGLYSNFADGLVFRDPYTPVAVGLKVSRMVRSVLTGDPGGGVDYTLKTVSGSGTNFLAELAAGNIIGQHPVVSGAVPFLFGIVDSVTNNTSLELTSYPLNEDGGAAIPFIKLEEESSVNFYTEVHTLNEMYSLVNYINPAELSGNGEYIIMQMYIVNRTDLVFLRDTISSDFDDDNVWFHGVAELEYTPGS